MLFRMHKRIKKQDEYITGLSKRIEKHLQKQEEEKAEGKRQIDALNQGMDQGFRQLQSAVQKHNMAIEDMLDEWEDWQSDEKGTRQRLRELEENEKRLLRLIEAYEQQFWGLKRFAAGKDEIWSEQVSLMEKNLEQHQKLCGIQLIEDTEGKVDYGLHEVIKAEITSDPALDKQIASIYSRGYLYKGKVMKKAQVAAYRVEKG